MSQLKDSQHLKIPLKDIEIATSNFEVCIGKGGFGRVYKGELFISGKLTTVAVKRLNENLGQGLKEFLTEIQLLSGQMHPNLISLLGYCDEGMERILVYEYAEHGSFDRYIRSSNTTRTLTWPEKLKICVGAARGLEYLHYHFGKHQSIIHRDIKSANVLLDKNWVAKISDLGLSKLSLAGLGRSVVISHACGTPGYCEPEYIISGIVKKESDVYSFGMVLFEVLCGRLCVVREADGFLLSANLIKDYYKKNKLKEIVDPGLRMQMSSDCFENFSAIAYRCLLDDRERRPPMNLVVRELEELVNIIQLGGGLVPGEEPVMSLSLTLGYGSPGRGCGGGNYTMCQADDCKRDLSAAKDYHRRHKVCEIHSQAAKALVGKQMQRFCQQCSRFHRLSEFDAGKRSCKRRLAGHNRLKRKTHPEGVVNLFPVLARAQMADVAPYEVDDCCGVLKVYNDGSIWRSNEPYFQVPVLDDGSVLWKDVLFDQPDNLYLRLYKPASHGPGKLPVFYYIHGGGFCIGSRTWPNCQNYCFKLAIALHAVIVAPDYRLAPENRLPLAVEDGFASIKWLQSQAVAADPDPWLVDSADFTRVFISGDSAGGNIAHNVAVRLGAGSKSLEPVQVKAYVLLAPFFGGTMLTESETHGPKDALLNRELINRFWRLSVPAGDTMDHPLVNPFGPVSLDLEQVELDPILVVCGGSDLLKDRVKDYAERLKNWGKKVKYVEFEDQQHGFFTINPDSDPAIELMQIINDFIIQHSS